MMHSRKSVISDALEAEDDATVKRLEQGTLCFDNGPSQASAVNLQSHPSAHVLKSLAKDKFKRSNTAPAMSTVNGELSSSFILKFEVVSARTIDAENEKKYVAYTVLVRKDGLYPEDTSPSMIERRYSDFLALYDSLRAEYPALMARVIFPKKVLLGNFAPGIISQRSAGFESLLEYICTEEKLKDSEHFTNFLQRLERDEGRRLIRAQQYGQALPLLESIFRLLNKFYTDRHPAVIIALCHVVACACTDAKAFSAERYADIALRRFEGISDADLLQFYVPLLQLCVHLWWQLDRDRVAIESRLENLKRRGIKVDGVPTLLDAIMALD